MAMLLPASGSVRPTLSMLLPRERLKLPIVMPPTLASPMLGLAAEVEARAENKTWERSSN